MHSAAVGNPFDRLSSKQLDAMLKRDLERHEAQQRMSRIQSKLEHARRCRTPPRLTT